MIKKIYATPMVKNRLGIEPEEGLLVTGSFIENVSPEGIIITGQQNAELFDETNTDESEGFNHHWTD